MNDRVMITVYTQSVCSRITAGLAFRRRIGFSILFLTLMMFFVPPLWAIEDSDCFLCHEDPDMTKTLPDGSVKSLYIDREVYTASIHAPEGCIACHSDIDDLPHPEDLAPADCAACHEETESYANTPHGKLLALGDKDISGCGDCHGVHDIRAAADPLSRVHPRNLPSTCGKCHSDPALVKAHMISVNNPTDKYLKSVHARAILEGDNPDAASCTKCHGTHDLRSSDDPESKVYHRNIPATCGECHPEELKEYEDSIHGRALYAGIKDAPVCTDCHGEHEIIAPDQPGSTVSRDVVARSTCPRCHDDERIMTRYGIETMRQASYMDSYHGMAGAAGSRIVASCTSCHNAHLILPQSDPNSSIHLDNLPNTCGQCHKNANPNFARGAVHIMPTHPGQKALGLVRLVYILLITAVIGGMVFHNTLMMGRHALLKFKMELGGEGTYRRFPSGLTIGHVILTIAFITLVLSGFALRYPESWWARHIFIGETGLAARGLIHRIAALVLVGLAVTNACFLLFTKSGRNELSALMFRIKDFKDAGLNMLFAVGLRREEPRFDRYGYIEKFEYWGMWWGSILMIVTGFCMWFANTFLTFLPKIALDIIALIHFYEAWLALLTIVIWHLYYMIFDPQTYPMNWSWITGHITEEDFKARHPLEYERVVKQRERAQSAAGADDYS